MKNILFPYLLSAFASQLVSRDDWHKSIVFFILHERFQNKNDEQCAIKKLN